ncbi:hypothetical protein BO221_01925 [Archangium sp. Cb G35]|uniref:hypothetical protein n=1 Tax=Archangium sp. Cb G35 TaxID=1920190 RepID=UPI00093739C9|nr:hypothetical protein [Archangium sp. Cb G35]OJT26807.1 hypothetical protein BO221_01925 [Archangium sp. Cb G35]
MGRTPPLAERLGHVTTQATFIQAALLAAHGAGARAGGFRASDVRFFFLLFTNWVEHDVTRPSQDLDLTQVRRTLERLCRSGWAEPMAGERSRKAPRGQRYLLTEAGLVSLAESLAELDRAPLEEALFVACFAASYLKAILARVQGRTVLGTAARRRVAQVLDPARILRNARRNTAAVLADLEERLRSGLALEEAAGEALAEGASEAQVVRRLESLGSYQLHRVRPLAELLLGLPDDLRRFELTEGIGMRSRLLFAPLAERSRAELALLERLEQHLAPRGNGRG